MLRLAVPVIVFPVLIIRIRTPNPPVLLPASSYIPIRVLRRCEHFEKYGVSKC